MNFKKKNIFFCPNKQTFDLAISIIKKNHSDQGVIFYIGNRIANAYKTPSMIKTIEYSLIKSLTFLLVNIFSINNIYFPHFKWKVVNLFLLFCKKKSIIDDGLDNFRKFPKNINLSRITSDYEYYTYDYGLPSAEWTLVFKKIFYVKKYNNQFRSKFHNDFDVSKFKTLIIESPGVDAYLRENKVTEPIIIFDHPNFKKNTIRDMPGKRISDTSIDLEKTIINYKGHIIVGETMLIVFILTLKNIKSKVNFVINEDNLDNLDILATYAQKNSKIDLKII